MSFTGSVNIIPKVAPLAGARIEICFEQRYEGSCKWSLPSRERGLKFVMSHDLIERLSRSPRGSAD